MSNKKGDLIAKQRKTNLAGDDEEDTDCLQLDVKRIIDRTLDDGRLQDRCIDIFFQVLDAENITMGKFLTCLVRKVTAAVDTVNEKQKHTEQLQSFVPEAVPDDIDKIPTLGDIGRCGFTTAMTGKIFDQLC